MQHKRVVLRHRIWRAAIVGISALGLAVAGLGITTASADHTPLDRTCIPPRCVPDLQYGPAPEHEMDAYPMRTGALAPTVVVVYGGGWVGGSRNGTAGVAETLAAEGFAVFNIDYRVAIGPPGVAGSLSGAEDGDALNQAAHDPALGRATEANRGDIERAVQWIKANGAEYGADVSDISLIGGSAGAQLVALAGQLLNKSTPGTIRSVVEMSGPMDFVTMVGNNAPEIRDGMPAYLGCPVETCTQAQLRTPSPYWNIHPASPSFMLINGDAEILPAQQATVFHEELQRQGEFSTLDIVSGTAGARHGFNLFPTEQGKIVQFLRGPADPTAPTVTKKTPTVHKNGVAPATNVSATFSEPVTGISAATFKLYNAAGSLVPTAFTYNPDTRVATLNPNPNLPADTQYTASLSGPIQDASGKRLATTVWKFTTGPKPKVTAQAPPNGFTGVSTTTDVSVTFSEPVVGVSTITFKVTTPTGTVVPAVVSRIGTTNQWVLDPTPTLTANTTFTVTATGAPSAGGIRDPAGNLIVTTKWTFTTGA